MDRWHRVVEVHPWTRHLVLEVMQSSLQLANLRLVLPPKGLG